jgi:Rod binding domain-containing protein
MRLQTELNVVGANHAATEGTSRNPKLEHSAHEFEASLMAELLKPLEESDGLTGQASEDAAGSSGALAGFAAESLARAISERGGFGIADRILHQLEHSGKAEHEHALPQRLKFSASPPI